MRRLFDALLSRWYVPRRRYDAAMHLLDVAGGIIDSAMLNTDDALRCAYGYRTLASSQIVITTDYQRGTPCS